MIRYFRNADFLTAGPILCSSCHDETLTEKS
jgi:hypothetical protein